MAVNEACRGSTLSLSTCNSPLYIIGDSEYSTCSSCFHRGHDRLSSACPRLIVESALETDDLEKIKTVERYIKDLCNSIAWNEFIPDESKVDSTRLRALVEKYYQVKISLENTEEPAALPRKRQKLDIYNSLHLLSPTNTEGLRVPSPPLLASAGIDAPMIPGLFIDHTAMTADFLMEVLPFVVNDGKNYGAIQLDYTRMTSPLLTRLESFFIKPRREE